MKTQQLPHATAEDDNTSESGGCINLTTATNAANKEGVGGGGGGGSGDDETDLINSSVNSVDNTSTASANSNRMPPICSICPKATVVSIIVKPQPDLRNRCVYVNLLVYIHVDLNVG